MITVTTIIIVFLVASVNLAAGYMAAVYLGMGPRSFNEFQKALAPRKTLVMRVPAGGTAVSAATAQQLDDPIESRCLELVCELRSFSKITGAAGTELRTLAAGGTEANIAEVLHRIADETHGHLEKLNTAIEPMERLEGNSSGIARGLTQLRASTDLVAVDLNAALGGPLAECQTLEPEEQLSAALAAVGQLREISHHYHAAVESSVMKILHAGVGLHQISRQLFVGEEGLLTCYGAEAMYRQMQESQQPMTGALLDIDHLKTFNKEYGGEAGDALFRSIATSAIDSLTGETRAGKVMGWRLLVLSTSLSQEELARWVEHLRQVIARTCFQCNGRIARATISGGVSDVAAGEPSSEMLERLCMTLTEAKNYGRNRTFVCQDEVPEPVVPVELTISETAVFLV